VGVLNLGDRSAALVDTNGEVRRVRIGEKLENSDWVLVSVSGQEATLQRRNEVRSVTVDQQF
jgi:Tfp pilus assembly protein PilP